jgi:hypothetical protein
MSITHRQAGDLLEENYGDWSWDDPEWWADMTEMLMEYPSVRALRRAEPWWHLPRQWPGVPLCDHGQSGPHRIWSTATQTATACAGPGVVLQDRKGG